MRQLEGRTGIHSSLISQYETGDAIPTTTRLIVLAEAFGVTPNDLLRGAYREPATIARETPEKLIQSYTRVSSVTPLPQTARRSTTHGRGPGGRVGGVATVAVLAERRSLRGHPSVLYGERPPVPC